MKEWERMRIIVKVSEMQQQAQVKRRETIVTVALVAVAFFRWQPRFDAGSPDPVTSAA